MKQTIAVFDFDGTITCKDTFIEFIRFCKGDLALYWGLFIYFPVLIAYKLRLYPNWKAKQMIFSYFFKGMSYHEFVKCGKDFSEIVDTILRQTTVDKIEKHLTHGDTIYVISASIEEWVIPWCFKRGIRNVLGTKVEITDDGRISGKFLSRNCYGQEKVNRLLEVEQTRSDYYLYAYGDSSGDKEMLAFADESFKI